MGVPQRRSLSIVLRGFSIGLAVTPLLTAPTSAQSPVPLGERVRITSQGEFTGRLQHLDGDSIVIAPDRRLVFRSFALHEVEFLEIDAGQVRSPGKGMLIGAAVGGAVGLAAGQFVGACEPAYPGDYCPSFTGYSAAGGLVIGALVGFLWAGGTRWEPVELPRGGGVTLAPRLEPGRAGLFVRLDIGS
jgi:hypothetical protein